METRKGFMIVCILGILLLVLFINLQNIRVFENLKISSSENKSTKVNTSGSIRLGYVTFDSFYNEKELEWLSKHADFLVLPASYEGKLDFIRENNPDIILLVYEFAGLHKMLDPDYTWINKSHEDWFLHDMKGDRITDPFDANTRENEFLMNWGNSGWKEYFSENMIDRVVKKRWDGIFLDGIPVNIHRDWSHTRGLLEYSNDMKFNRAVLDFLKVAYKRFKEKGKLFVPNFNEAKKIKGLWKSFLEFSSGGEEESFVNIYGWSPKTFLSEKEWEDQIENYEYTTKNGKIYFAVAHNRGMNKKDTLYNAASYLIGKMGDKAFFYNDGGVILTRKDYYVLDDFIHDYNTFRYIYKAPIGKPLGDRYSKGGVWQRNFTNGKVLVNPSYISFIIKLGKNYTTLSGENINKITLSDHEGAILFNR